MAKKTAPLLPSTAELLTQFGARLRVARLRRKLSAKQVAERAGMSPMTLRSVERGGSGVTLGAYVAVMQVLGVEKDLELLVQADPIGRELQDARMLKAPSPTKATQQPAKGDTRQLREMIEDLPGAQLRRALEDLPGAQLRRALEDLPGAQLRRALDALPETQLRDALSRLPVEQLRESLKRTETPSSLTEAQGVAARGQSSWIKTSGFASSEALSDLIKAPSRKHRP